MISFVIAIIVVALNLHKDLKIVAVALAELLLKQAVVVLDHCGGATELFSLCSGARGSTFIFALVLGACLFTGLSIILLGFFSHFSGWVYLNVFIVIGFLQSLHSVGSFTTIPNFNSFSFFLFHVQALVFRFQVALRLLRFQVHH